MEYEKYVIPMESEKCSMETPSSPAPSPIPSPLSYVKHISRKRREQLKIQKESNKKKMQYPKESSIKRRKNTQIRHSKVYCTYPNALSIARIQYYMKYTPNLVYITYGKADKTRFFLESPTFLDKTIPEKYKPYYATQLYSLKNVWKHIEYYKKYLSFYTSHTSNKNYTSNSYSVINELQEFLQYFTFYTRIRYQFKRLIQRWSQRYLYKKVLNDTDPFTLMPITKPLILVDINLRGHWKFDAPTFLEYVESKICYHEELILEPQMPNHPFTNIPLTFPILRDLIQQAKKYQVTSWICDAFVEYNGDLRLFTNDFSYPLRKRCLENVVTSPHDSNFSYLFHDFLEDQFEYNNVENNELFNIIQRAVRFIPTNTYCKKWTSLFKEYYLHFIAGNTMHHSDLTVRSIYMRSCAYLTETVSINNLHTQLENYQKKNARCA
jgi:hypothetical protein